MSRWRDMGRARYSRGYVELTAANNWKAHWYHYIKDESGQERRVHRSAIVGNKARMRKFEAESELAKRSGDRSRKDITLKEFVEARWKPLKEGKWEDSTRTTNEELLSIIVEKFGSLKLSEIDKVELQTWLNQLAKERSQSAVWHIRTFLKSILLEAVEQEYITKDPARSLERPRTRKPDETVLDWAQYQAVIGKLSHANQLIVKVAAACALRPEELFGFRWRNFVTLTNSRPALLVQQTVYRGKVRPYAKTEGSQDYVALPFRLSEELSEWRKSTRFHDDDDYIFPNSRGGFIIKDNFLNRILYPVRDELKLPKLNFQVLRRTFATKAYGDGRGNLKDVQKHLRHAKPDTSLEHYIKALPDSVFKMVDAMYEDMMAEPKVIQ